MREKKIEISDKSFQAFSTKSMEQRNENQPIFAIQKKILGSKLKARK